MADRFYEKIFGKFARGQINWSAAGGDTFRAVLVDASYIPDTTNHEFLSDIPVSARHGRLGSELRSDAILVPVADATPTGACTSSQPLLTFPEMPAYAPTLPYLVLFKDDGLSDASSPLILLLDSTAGLPAQPNGADIVVAWNVSPAGIFHL